MCWFCKRAYSEPWSVCETRMYGDVKVPGDHAFSRTIELRTFRTIYRKPQTWRGIVISVPRCRDCKAVHDHNSHARVLGCLGSAAIGGVLVLLSFAVPQAIETGDFVGISLLLFVLVTIVAAILWRVRASRRIGAEMRSRGVPPSSYVSQYPRVRELTAIGWKIGKSPPLPDGWQFSTG